MEGSFQVYSDGKMAYLYMEKGMMAQELSIKGWEDGMWVGFASFHVGGVEINYEILSVKDAIFERVDVSSYVLNHNVSINDDGLVRINDIILTSQKEKSMV